MKLCNKTAWLSTIGIGFLLVLIPIVISLNFHKIFVDSAYYCVIIERISEGYIPYKTIQLGYTPLWLYIMAGLKMLFGIPYGCYHFYLAFTYIIEFASAYFLFRICTSFGAKKEISILCALLLVLLMHWCQGNYVMLDPPAVFFGLASIRYLLLFFQKHSIHFLWIGILASCSFLSKQFGFGFFFLCLFLICFSKERKLSKSIFFILGYMIPICCCYIFYGDIFNNVIFSSYGTPTSLKQKMIFCLDRFLFFCVRILPAVLISLIFIPRIIRKGLFVPYIFCWLGIGGFSLQYAFTGADLHYYLFMLPFGLILLSLISQVQEEGKKFNLYKFAVLITILNSVFSTYYNVVYKFYLNKENPWYLSNIDLDMANRVKSYIKPNETVFIRSYALIHLYYTANLIPPDMESWGYSFVMPKHANKAIEAAQHADWVLYGQNATWEMFDGDTSRDFILSHPRICIDKERDIYLYRIK